MRQSGNEVSHLFSVTLRPIGQGKHVVDDIQASRLDQVERFMQQPILASPSVGKDEVEVFIAKGAQIIIAVDANNF